MEIKGGTTTSSRIKGRAWPCKANAGTSTSSQAKNERGTKSDATCFETRRDSALALRFQQELAPPTDFFYWAVGHLA
jgi:hypothetical protein